MSTALSIPAEYQSADLPSLISMAGQRLLNARDSAEVLEAKRMADFALHYSKVMKAANESHADCLRVITRAEMRMADEIDAGQARGEIAKQGDGGKYGGGRRDREIFRGSEDLPAKIGDLGVDARRVADWRKVRDAGEEVVERAIVSALSEDRPPTKADILRAVKGRSGQLVQQSLSNEHYTPPEYVESARQVMGAIDLDPASCDEANETVRAMTIYTVANDGLDQDWFGRVWMNPPYGRLAGDFVNKLIEEIEAGRVSEAVVLVNAHCTDTKWFQPLWDGTLCFTDHRINFYGDDERSGSTHGSVFVYFGDSADAFCGEFSEYGPIVERRKA